MSCCPPTFRSDLYRRIGGKWLYCISIVRWTDEKLKNIYIFEEQWPRKGFFFHVGLQQSLNVLKFVRVKLNLEQNSASVVSRLSNENKIWSEWFAFSFYFFTLRTPPLFICVFAVIWPMEHFSVQEKKTRKLPVSVSTVCEGLWHCDHPYKG